MTEIYKKQDRGKTKDRYNFVTRGIQYKVVPHII